MKCGCLVGKKLIKRREIKRVFSLFCTHKKKKKILLFSRIERLQERVKFKAKVMFTKWNRGKRGRVEQVRINRTIFCLYAVSKTSTL